jgi:hypothetical protein
MKLYMKVTSDKYELPLAVAKSVTELAKACGVTRNTIWQQMWMQRTGKVKHCCYHCVEVEDDTITLSGEDARNVLIPRKLVDSTKIEEKLAFTELENGFKVDLPDFKTKEG